MPSLKNTYPDVEEARRKKKRQSEKARVKRKMAECPEYRAKVNKKKTARRQQKMEEDPKYRAAVISRIVAAQKKQYREDPAFRQKKIERAVTRHKNMMHQSLEYKSKQYERVKVWAAKERAFMDLMQLMEISSLILKISKQDEPMKTKTTHEYID